VVYDFDELLDTEEGWAKCNRHYWLRDWRGYAEFFFGELACEPHSTKQREDCVGWAMEIGPETMLLHDDGPKASSSREETEALLGRVTCPVLVIHGQGIAASRSRAVSGSPRSPAASCWCWRAPGTCPRPGVPAGRVTAPGHPAVLGGDHDAAAHAQVDPQDGPEIRVTGLGTGQG
jgi:hypothetical protein